MKTLNPTMNLTQRMTHKALMLLALVLLMSGALACGDSAAVYAVRDEPGAMMGDDDNDKPDGKGDVPADPDPEPVVPTAPSENVALSRATLRWWRRDPVAARHRGAGQRRLLPWPGGLRGPHEPARHLHR
jgi:hypothetical protein